MVKIWDNNFLIAKYVIKLLQLVSVPVSSKNIKD